MSVLAQTQQLEKLERLARRRDVPRLDVQPLARDAQPGRGPRLGDSVREREHARTVDEEARATGLEVERTPRGCVVVDDERPDEAEWRLGLPRALHPDGQGRPRLPQRAGKQTPR